MRFIIRADAYRISGAGHVMRSSVIAEELIDRGYEVYFVGNLDEIPWVSEYISNLGFKGISKPEEHFQTNQKTDTLILDSYDISIADPFIQPNNWNKTLILVDDTTPSYIGDIYLHSGAETSWAIPNTKSTSKLLVGLEYLLIRKSLRKRKDAFIENNNNEIKILISAGGSDPFAFSQNLVKLLSESFFTFHAFVLAPDFQLPNQDSRFEFIELGKAYESLLSTIDLVFTTAGTSSWEYHFLGIPVALANAVKNQDRNYRYQISNGFSWDLGYRDYNGLWKLNEPILKSLLSSNSKNRTRLHNKEINVDGSGVSRILELII
jgi:UDP-2,4-diacetamido-2,4,6-trideoxy-beta-L-altropyranose hydrolase